MNANSMPARAGVEHRFIDVGGGLTIQVADADGVDSKDTAMKVHHLNCGTMNPPATASVVCHLLLVETDSGLVLVDTGFGSHAAGDIRLLLTSSIASSSSCSMQAHSGTLGAR